LGLAVEQAARAPASATSSAAREKLYILGMNENSLNRLIDSGDGILVYRTLDDQPIRQKSGYFVAIPVQAALGPRTTAYFPE
jgi:hypothetical protein